MPEPTVRKTPIDEILVNKFIEINPHIIYVNGGFINYNETRGYYTQKNKDELKRTMYSIGADLKPTVADIEASIKRLQFMRFIDRIPTYHTLNLANGWLNLDDELGMSLEHGYERIFTSKINIHYIEKSECPRFDRFLLEVLEPDTVEYMWKILGFMLDPVDGVEKSWVFVGNGSNGKTVLVEIIKLLMGKDAVISSTPSTEHELERTLPMLPEKKLWVMEELPRKAILNSGILKSFISGGEITTNKLYNDAFTFKSKGRILITSNDFPNFGDTSNGTKRRFDIINFPNTFSQDLTLLPKLREELPGILYKAVEARKLLKEANWMFVKPESVEEYGEEQWALNNPIKLFVDEHLVKDPKGVLYLTDLYTTFAQLSTDNCFTDKAMFSRELNKLGVKTIRKQIGGIKAQYVYGWKIV